MFLKSNNVPLFNKVPLLLWEEGKQKTHFEWVYRAQLMSPRNHDAKG